MVMGAPSVNAVSYASAINSGSQRDITPANPIHSQTMGSMNMYTLLARHGPGSISSHMKLAGDPTFKEYSLATPTETPATRFPLGEYGTIDLLGGYNSKPENGGDPLKHTVEIYNAKDTTGKKGKQNTNAIPGVAENLIYLPPTTYYGSSNQDAPVSQEDNLATIDDIGSFLDGERKNKKRKSIWFGENIADLVQTGSDELALK